MLTYELVGHQLEYDEGAHEYIVDGILVPSVTRIVRWKTGSKYDNVPAHVLKAAAEKGTLLHKTIELYEINEQQERNEAVVIPEEIREEFSNYLGLKRLHDIEVCGNEMPVIIPLDGEIVAAGTLDLMICAKGRLGIADLKRTSSLDKDSVAWQVNLYAIGAEYSYGIKSEVLKAIHLYRDKRKVLDIPIDREMTKELLREYVNARKTETP